MGAMLPAGDAAGRVRALGAFRRSWQPSINICLGSALATIGLPVTAVLAIGLFSGMAACR